MPLDITTKWYTLEEKTPPVGERFLAKLTSLKEISIFERIMGGDEKYKWDVLQLEAPDDGDQFETIEIEWWAEMPVLSFGDEDDK